MPFTNEEVRRLREQRAQEEEPKPFTADDISSMRRPTQSTAPDEESTTPQDIPSITLEALDHNTPEVSATEAVRELTRASNSVYLKQRLPDQAFGDYVQILKDKGGLETDFAMDPEFRPKIEAQAATDTLRFMRNTQVNGVPLLEIQGKGMDDAKNRIKEAFTIAAIARNAPVVGKDARVLAGGMIRTAVKEQLTRAFDQAIAEKNQGGQVEVDTERLAALGAIVEEAPNSLLFRAMTVGFMIDPTDPISPTEKLRQTPPNTLANTPLFRGIFEGSIGLTVQRAASQIGEVNRDGEIPSARNGEDVIASIAAILGDNWHKTLRQRWGTARTNYNLGKLGIQVETGSAKPGYSNDGHSFIPLLSGDAFDLLNAQAAVTLRTTDTRKFLAEQLESNPDFDAVITAAEKRYGKVRGLRELHKMMLEKAVDSLSRGQARLNAMGTEPVDTNLTPFERDRLGRWNEGFLDIMGRGEQLFSSFTRTLTRVDKSFNNAFTNITGVALDKNFSYHLTGSDDLAESSDGFFEALAAASAMSRDQGKFMSGLRTFFGAAVTDPDIIRNHPMFAGSTPAQVAALLKEDVDVSKIYARNTKEATQSRKNRLARMSRFLRGIKDPNITKPDSAMVFMWDVAVAMGDMLGQAARDIGRVASEQPEVAVATILLEIPAEMGTAAVFRGAREVAELAGGAVVAGSARALSGTSLPHRRLSNIINAAKTSQALERLAIANPMAARRISTRLKDAVADATARGATDEIADRLGAAASSAKRLADEVETTSIVSVKGVHDMSKKVADVWDAISAEPGGMSRIIEAVDGKVRQGGILNDASVIAREMFGSKKRPRITTDDIVFDPDTFDEVTHGIDQLLHGGSELENTASAMHKLAESSNRKITELTADEIGKLLPDEISDVISIVDQAQKIPIDQPNFFGRLVDRMRGDSGILPALKQTVEETATLFAQRVMDRTEVLFNWNLAKKRASRVLQHLRDRRVTERAILDADFEQQLSGVLDDDAAAQALTDKFDKAAQLSDDRISAIDDLYERMRGHDADLDFDIRQLGPITEQGPDGRPLLSDADIEHLVTEAPELFGVLPSDVLKYQVKGKGSTKQIDAANTRLANKEKLLVKERKRLEKQEATLKEKGAEDPSVDIGKMDQRAHHIEDLVDELGALRSKTSNLKEGRLTLLAVHRKKFFDPLQHRGLGSGGRARKVDLQNTKQAVATSKSAELSSNPFLPNALPIRQMFRHAAGAIKNLGAWMHGRVIRTRLLAKQLDELSPDERVLLDETLDGLRGEGPGLTLAQAHTKLRDVVGRHPGLGRFLEDPSKPKLVRDFVNEIDNNLGQLYALMESLGVDAPVIAKFREKGFDPQLYGLFERPGLISGEPKNKLPTGADQSGITVAEPLLTATGQSLRFQRRVSQYRLVIDEPTNRIDRAFDTAAQVKGFLRRRYGKNIKLRPGEQTGVEVANIEATGDIVRLGSPISVEELNILDPIGGRAERMVVGISRAYRDLGSQQALQSMNIFKNLVLDTDQMTAFRQTHGSKVNDIYTAIPNNSDIFGALAGKFVHRKALADVNRAANAFDGLDHVLKGMREVMHRTGGADAFPEQLIREGVGGFGGAVDALTGVIKQNQILLSSRVWMGNVIFNMVTDAMSGAGLYTSREGWKSVAWAWRSRLRALSLPPVVRRGVLGAPEGSDTRTLKTASDPIVNEAIEQGLDVGFFEGVSGPNAMGDMIRRMTSFDDLTKIEAKALQRDELLKKLDRRATKTPGDRKKILQLERDLTALELQQQDMTNAWWKKLGRNITAMLGNQGTLAQLANDVVGRRGGPTQNRFWEVLRELYNNFDAAHKMGTYHHLRVNKGWGKEEASQFVKDFSQNYRDIPTWLRPVGGKGALLSLVTSFPYEATRIGTNLMAKHGTSVMAMASMIPMVNMAMLTSQGIDMDEFYALLETRGLKTKTDASLSLFDTLYIPGPGNTITSSIDIGLINPWPNLITNDFSPTARIMEGITGVDDEIDMLTQIPARFVGNFLLNNPLFGGTVGLSGGIDVGSGAPLFDKRMSTLQKIGVMGESVAKSVIPPWAPFSRPWQDYAGAAEAPINPRTGRPFGGGQRGTTITSQLGFRAKGRAATAVGDLFAPITDPIAKLFTGRDKFNPGRGVIDFATPENVLINILREASEDPASNREKAGSFPIHSKSSELRKWTLRALQSDDPEKRAVAEQQMDEIIKENYERHWKPLGRTRELTDRERQKLFNYIKDYTVEAQMGRLSVHAQAAVLRQMDNLGIFSDNRMRDMIHQVRFSPLGNPKISSDPQLVQSAIQTLETHFERKPNASPRLKSLVSWLKNILPQSERRYKKEIFRRNRRESRERTARRVREQQ